MNSVVDEFWIIEGNYTFTGTSKNLVFKDQIQQSNWPTARIKHFPFLAPSTISADPWVNEFAQLIYIGILLGQCNPADLVLNSDVDEITRLESFALDSV